MRRDKEYNKTSVFNYIVDYVASHGYPPTVREIITGSYVNNVSVQIALVQLEQEGRIKVNSGARAIRLIGYKLTKEGE